MSLNPRSEVRRVAFSFLFSINPVSSSVTAIGNAYAVLSNPEKRQQYDKYGDQAAAAAAPQSANHRRAGHYRSFHRDFEADISPEELFNIFFGGRFPTGRTETQQYLVNMSTTAVLLLQYSSLIGVIFLSVIFELLYDITAVTKLSSVEYIDINIWIKFYRN